MGCTLKGSKVPGFWGRDISKRIDAEQIPEKILALLWDKIQSRGKDVFLWQQVTDSYSGHLICSCNKDTTKRPDITCASCYGTKLIPGYVKFAHTTFFMSSISPGLTLTNTTLNQDIKPHRILLNSGSLTGTVVFAAIAYSNPSEYDWDYRVDAANIKSTNTVVVEFSTNGILYHPIASINTLGTKPISTGSIYIRVTLTRASLTDRSPEFEIVRLRIAKTDKPYIKILRPQVTELPNWMVYGQRVENMGERFWTVPLNIFDDTITPDTADARIVENSIYARINGISKDDKFVTTKLSFNEQFQIFSSQSFETRKAQPEELYNRLMF